MQKFEAEKLLEKYKAGECTPEEKAIIEDYMVYEGITPRDLLSIEPEMIIAKEKVMRIAAIPKITSLPVRIATVAAAIAIITTLVLFYIYPARELPNTYANDINPGGNKAILTLANGNQINLNDAKSGALVSESGFEIVKDKDGQISYKVSGSASGTNEYNTITTPRGGQFIVTLPDGSKVMLNAGSSMKYPTSFAKSLTRKVELSGEAYFEITKDTKHPFIVATDLQEVEVLGTHFNVSAYNDEASVKTTLLEGSVKVTPSLQGTKQSPGSIILKPNEQSSLTKNNIQIKQVDTDEAVAWKSGEFLFRNEPLESIMRKISRWYDVKVVYEDQALAKELFGGMISRSGKISEVLQVLEITKDVHFKVEGRTVTVMK